MRLYVTKTKSTDNSEGKTCYVPGQWVELVCNQYEFCSVIAEIYGPHQVGIQLRCPEKDDIVVDKGKLRNSKNSVLRKTKKIV